MSKGNLDSPNIREKLPPSKKKSAFIPTIVIKYENEKRKTEENPKQ